MGKKPNEKKTVERSGTTVYSDYPEAVAEAIDQYAILTYDVSAKGPRRSSAQRRLVIEALIDKGLLKEGFYVTGLASQGRPKGNFLETEKEEATPDGQL